MSLLLVFFLIFNIANYFILKQLMEYKLGLHAKKLAVAVSLLVSEDIDGYMDFLDERDVDSEYYKRMQDLFNKIKKDGNIQFIYTVNNLDDLNYEFILTSIYVGDSDYLAPGDTDGMSAAKYKVFAEKEPTIIKPSVSPYGILLGGSAPILDEDDDVVGAVGVSINNSVIFSSIRNLFFTLFAICILLLGLIFFLFVKVSHLFLEPLLKDKLTEAYNKRYFDTIMRKSIAAALKLKQELSIVMLDLDHFKKVNDTFGHPFGDIVLSSISCLIRDCLRKNDILIRYGGEEFLVLLSNIDITTAVNVAERIRKKVESHEIYNEKENTYIKLTVSSGIAALKQRNLSPMEFVNKADDALYRAKEIRNTAIMCED